MITINCKRCEGTGLEPPRHDKPCIHPKCKEGQVPVEHDTPLDPDFPDTEDGRLVQRLCNIETLTDWEIKFCNSVTQWVMSSQGLSAGQRQKIDEILEVKE